MKFYSVKETDMVSIADAIRAKTGKTDGMTPAQMGEEIAAIETGGGDSMSPCVLTTSKNLIQYWYSSSILNGGTSETFTFTLPAKSRVLSAYSSLRITGSSSYNSSSAKSTASVGSSGAYTIESDTDSGVTVSVTAIYNGSTSFKYRSMSGFASIIFTHPGIYTSENDDGIRNLIADQTVSEFPSNSIFVDPLFCDIDLSNSTISSIPVNAFYGTTAKRIIFPGTLETLGYGSLANVTGLEVIDMSSCNAVPTLSSTATIGTASNPMIRVPAALYDEWIAATNWSTFADYIVAV